MHEQKIIIPFDYHIKILGTVVERYKKWKKSVKHKLETIVIMQ
jgi:hypothetical protein